MIRYSNISKILLIATLCLTVFLSVMACKEKKQDEPIIPEPPTPELPELPVTAATHNYKSPLYWTIYEYAREWELAGVPYDQMDLTSDQWDAVIDMMATRFKPYGYDMICTDGFLPQLARDGGIYMSHYGSQRACKACESKGT